ncbi:MAG TPA: ABC transporter ATP-binding protein [Candidatus Paceibacterota bacterium]|nr:ABC transporter ATP-binding protein [Candidatus Paceibacterota bacterium]
MASARTSDIPQIPPPSLIGLLRPYWMLVLLLIILTVAGSALGLIVPQLIAHAIDAYTQHTLNIGFTILWLTLVALGIFILLNVQSVVQVYASEIVARDLRTKVAAAISVQEYAAIEKLTPSKLLTNLTSDIDAIKTFISQAIASLVSSVFLIIGASALLLWLDWRLALAVLGILPFIAGTFYVVLGRVRKLFRQVQEAVDRLNKVINESILGAALVRLLNSRSLEHDKFNTANQAARSVSMQILNLFAAMIPVITFLTNIATLVILTLGGHFVITGGMTLGEFTAFNSYLSILIFPIIIIGFMSNAIAQAQASYVRITEVLNSPVRPDTGTVVAPLTGAIEVKDLSLSYGEHPILKDVSFSIAPRTKNAIIGPTAAGKSQLLYLMTGLLNPTSGRVTYDGVPLSDYSKEGLHAQVGFVFQDSVLFNLTLRENIAFSNLVKDEDLTKAIDTAELHDFIGALPNGLDTVVSERGTSLSGGQKQRVMLARALALNPKILLLDDFTARVDGTTEAKILSNLMRNYPDITLISITQKIAPVEKYDQIIVLMEGEVLGVGTHPELMRSTPEYVQIFDSQKSTEHYEAA